MEIKCRWGPFFAVTSSSLLMSFVGGLIFVSGSGSRRNRLCSQIRSRLLPDSVASAPGFGRVCSQIRMRLLPRSLTSFRSGLREWGERGRECGWRLKCLLRVRGPHFASKVSYRAGAAGWRSFPFSLIYINESAQSLAEDWAEILSEVCFVNYQWMAISANPIGSPALIMRVALRRM